MFRVIASDLGITSSRLAGLAMSPTYPPEGVKARLAVVRCGVELRRGASQKWAWLSPPCPPKGAPKKWHPMARPAAALDQVVAIEHRVNGAFGGNLNVSVEAVHQ